MLGLLNPIISPGTNPNEAPIALMPCASWDALGIREEIDDEPL
jgi:hypothetical protein